MSFDRGSLAPRRADSEAMPHVVPAGSGAALGIGVSEPAWMLLWYSSTMHRARAGTDADVHIARARGGELALRRSRRLLLALRSCT